MSSGFSVEAAKLYTKVPAMKSASGVEKDIYGPSDVGVLTKEDKKMLEDFSGLKFDFPPRPGQLYPAELMHISQARMGEYQEGVKFSDLGSLLGKVQRSYQMMTGKDVISPELMSFVSDQKRTGGGSWAGYNS